MKDSIISVQPSSRKVSAISKVQRWPRHSRICQDEVASRAGKYLRFSL